MRDFISSGNDLLFFMTLDEIFLIILMTRRFFWG